MADISGAGTPSRSQIEAWDTEHLHAAGAHWTATAAQWEEHYSAIHAGMLAPGGTVWEGSAAETAQERAWADLVKVRGLADHLHDASAAARTGADDISWAKRQVLDSITEAEENQFTVGEDLSVTPPGASSPFARVPIAEAVAAQDYAAQIASRAQALASIDQQVAGKITAALAPLQQASFGDSAGGRAPVMQAMGNKYKTDERVSPEPGDPNVGGTGGGMGRLPPEEPEPRPYTELPRDGSGRAEQDIGHDSAIVAADVKTISKVPLTTDRGQIERKFDAHATDFGVTDPRGRVGFDNFNNAVKQEVNDPGTIHIQGEYRGNPAILNYNPNSGLCVVQNPDGSFVSGWKLSPGQIFNVVNKGKLGGG